MNGADQTGTIDTPTSFGGVSLHPHLAYVLAPHLAYVLGVGGAHGRSSPVLLFHCMNRSDQTGRVEWCTS
jgi:hypothetical protein